MTTKRSAAIAAAELDELLLEIVCEAGHVPAHDTDLVRDIAAPSWYLTHRLPRNADDYSIGWNASGDLVIVTDIVDDERVTLTVLSPTGWTVLDGVSFPRTVLGVRLLAATLTAAMAA